MRYWIKTKEGPVEFEWGGVIVFNSYSDARHYAINNFDLSDKGLEIVQVKE